MTPRRGRWLLLTLLALAAAGVLAYRLLGAVAPGAGAAYQEAPDSAPAGGVARISLRLAVWGSGGQADARYKDVRLHTRASNNAEWTTWRAARIETAPPAQGPDPGVTHVFDVAIPDAVGATLSYRFTFVFDQQKKEVEGMKQIRIEAPAGVR